MGYIICFVLLLQVVAVIITLETHFEHNNIVQGFGSHFRQHTLLNLENCTKIKTIQEIHQDVIKWIVKE